MNTYYQAEKKQNVKIDEVLNTLNIYLDLSLTELEESDFTEGMIDILTLLVKSGLVPSKSEARRAVQQGGVSVNGEKVEDIKTAYAPETFDGEDFVLKRGKKNFRKIVMK